MLYFYPWTVFGDNIKGLNSKCDDDGSSQINDRPIWFNR